MSRVPIQKNYIFNNLEMFKRSYKVTPPQEISWGALGSQLKIEQIASIEPSVDQQTWSQEVSSNPFVKTKQLFKNKNVENSVIEDDLTNQFIFTAQRQLEPQEQDKNFQFDSFGLHNNQIQKEQPKLLEKYPSNASSQQVKAWNSSSLEINFEKVRKDELILPDPLDKVGEENHFFYNKIENNDSSIKEFCFKLNETNEYSLEKTPIKKWSELKQSKASASLAKDSEHKKLAIKKIISNFMQKLESIPQQRLTDEFIKNTKTLLDNIGQKEERIPLRERINESLQTSKRKGKQMDDDSSTLRLYTQESENKGRTQRREKTEMTEYKYSGKFKIYQCNSKKKEIKTTPIKNDKKAGANKQKRFKV